MYWHLNACTAVGRLSRLRELHATRGKRIWLSRLDCLVNFCYVLMLLQSGAAVLEREHGTF